MHEQICFTEMVLFVLKDELLSAPSLSRQIGALYMFYAVFHKQPLDRFVRMRLSAKDCDKLIQFLQLLQTRSQSLRQPLAILSRLLFADHAFLFVAHERQFLKATYTVSKRSLKSRQEDALADFAPLNLRLEMEDVLDREEGLVAGMEILQVAYNEMKEELDGSDPNLVASGICAAVNVPLDRIAALLNKTEQLTAADGSGRELEKSPGKETRKSRILKKISAIQMSKNTLVEQGKEETEGSSSSTGAGTSSVMLDDGDVVYIDATFLNKKKSHLTSKADKVVTEELSQEVAQEIDMADRPGTTREKRRSPKAKTRKIDTRASTSPVKKKSRRGK